MSEKINREDFLLTLLGAFQMANQNLTVEQEEQSLLKKLIHTANVSQGELAELHSHTKDDILRYVDKLSNNFAKKFFLVTLATVAMADESIDKEEQEMINELSETLQVGKIKLDVAHYPQYEQKVLSLLQASL